MKVRQSNVQVYELKLRFRAAEILYIEYICIINLFNQEKYIR